MKHHQTWFSSGKNLPYLSLLTGVLALILFSYQDAGHYLQYDRTAIAGGEFWRLVTGHWTHWSFDHLLWCSISFVALGALCERLNRKVFIIALALATIIIPAFCWFADPAMEQYRGLSGLCSGLFMLGSLQMMCKALAEKDLSGLALPAIAALLFFGKILFEFINGQAIFVKSGNIFSPVPLAHLTGGIAGMATVIFTGFQTRDRNPKNQLFLTQNHV